MFDAVDVDNIPANWTGLVAGYYGGAKIPTTLPALRARLPLATIVDICVTASQDGTVADCESGDLRPEECPGWARRQRERGADPTVYASLANWPAVRAAFAAADEPLPWWWCAEWDGDPTLPDDPHCVAKQYTNGVTPSTAPNRVPGCDTSIVADYWPGVDLAPAPSSTRPLRSDMFELIHNTVTGEIVAWSSGGTWWHVPNPDWAKVALADSVLCGGQRDVGQAEFDLLKALASSARSAP
jgi:hypothetical protein